MIRTGLRTSRPKPMEMLNGPKVCDTCLTTPMRMSSTCRKPSSASCVVRNWETRTACVSLLPVTNLVAAFLKIMPKPASGGQRQWKSFKHKKGKMKMKKNKKLLIAIGAAVLISIMSLMVYKSQNEEASGDVIRIGAILPLTGNASVFGKYNYEVTKVSVDILSQAFSRRNITIVEDSKSLPKDAMSALIKINTSGSCPNIVCTELSSIANAIYPLASQKNSLLVAIATARDLRNKSDAIQIYPSAKQIFDCLMIFTSRVKGERVTVFYINDDFGTSVREYFESNMGIENFFNFIPFDSSTDIKSLVVKGVSPISFVCGYGSQFVSIIRELQTRKQSKYIVASPEFAFPEYFNSVDIKDGSLFYMDFMKYGQLSQILGNKLNRSINPIDFLVFGGYLAVFQAADAVINKGEKLSGKILFDEIQGETFIFKGFEVSFDETGTAIYDLEVSSATNLLQRR